MNVLKVNNVVFGKGKTKICIPVVGTTKEEILNQIKALQNLNFDLVEWRIDWFDEVWDFEKVKDVLLEIREKLKGIPLLCTFRTLKEGGEKEISCKEYVKLNTEIAKTGLVDIIDVEVFTGDIEVKKIIEVAHKYNVNVIASNHDFDKTPSKEEIINRLIKMQDLGADMLKIAVMPNSKRDVLELLNATVTMQEEYATKPIITMSMSQKGLITRLSGEIFGSCLTFGSSCKASAPGQIQVDELNQVLDIIHKNIL